MFQHDEEEYKKLNSQLKEQVGQAQLQSLEKMEEMLASINEQYKKCQSKLQELKSYSEKNNLRKEIDKVKKYNDDLKQSKSRIDRMTKNIEKQKNKLDAIQSGQTDMAESSNLQKNIQQSEISMAKTQESNYHTILQINAVAAQGNMVTDSTIQKLHEQNENINKIISGINQVDENLTLIDRIRRVVSNKAMLEKLLLFLMVIILVIANLIILYYKITR
ncbi:transmembrane protein, putative (macronuclear) [Tetrahymena thermophila SB210]|uniref:Transmembrane protein, putative n=1 Tax=Tetrahymena thermophila (strain SB210) TaxID=312017 RepID=Q23H39_TETTS|nr:transmembrane protein, putative [Tetrahymena thermophila SB210]EAR95808.2 transmembrane protein, putative [Tetrahymena thermophila SB210]|eukprot:XP_001016053.2 transmembrane protein, putative [Tetrahymena thermophila SB210]